MRRIFNYSALTLALWGGGAIASAQTSVPPPRDTLDPALIQFDSLTGTESGSVQEPTPTPVAGNKNQSLAPRTPTGPLPIRRSEKSETATFHFQSKNEQSNSALSPLQFKIGYPNSIVLNESAEVRVTVTNPNDVEVQEAKLILTLPKHVRFAGATPAPIMVSEKQIEFVLHDLFAHGTSEVMINVLPVDKNPISFETQLMIVNRERVEIAVQEPVLEVFVNSPPRLVVGEPTDIEVLVINTGDGPARDIRLKPSLPKGTQLVGTSELDLFCDQLATGEKHSFRLKALALTEGPAKLEFAATATAAAAKTAGTSYLVIKPDLQLEVIGPKQAFVNHETIYGFQLKNPSDVDLTDVTVALNVPTGLKVVTVSRECANDAGQNQLVWKFPTLKAGETADVQWIASSSRVGNYVFGLSMQSRETKARLVNLPTAVDARPDVTMTIRNDRDPVPAGEATEYVITIENHGATAANNLNVKVELPSNWVAIAKQDAALPQPQRVVEFPVNSIGAKQKQELRFKAGSNVAGEYVVRAKLGIGNTNIQLTADDYTLVFKPESQRVSEKSEPTIR